jgi:arsenate reductase
MAEAWTRHLHGDRIEPHSAGLDPSKIDPRAVRVMEEVEVDLTRQRSKHVVELFDVDFDLVITLCDHARQTCPSLPRAKRSTHVGFDDPPRLAADARDNDEALVHYRRVRDEIRAFVEELPHRLGSLADVGDSPSPESTNND